MVCARRLRLLPYGGSGDSRLDAAGEAKTYLGYSDAGMLLAALYQAGFDSVAHGPVVQDIVRGRRRCRDRSRARLDGRSVAGERWNRDPGIRQDGGVQYDDPQSLARYAVLQPDFDGHVLMLEEVSEAMYRIDRSLFHITGNPAIQAASGIMLGRCSDITPNDPDLAMNEEQVARYWCLKSGFPGWAARHRT